MNYTIATSQQACQIKQATRRLGVLINQFLHSQLTAISELSSSTYSCGGEGCRFGGGVSDSFLKYLVMPTGSSTAIGAFSSSVGGADDSDDRSESESDDMLDLGVVLREQWFGSGEGKMVSREKVKWARRIEVQLG